MDRTIWDVCQTVPIEPARLAVGDWVETDRGEVGQIEAICDSKLGDLIELCVGRCMRIVDRENIVRTFTGSAQPPPSLFAEIGLTLRNGSIA